MHKKKNLMVLFGLFFSVVHADTQLVLKSKVAQEIERQSFLGAKKEEKMHDFWCSAYGSYLLPIHPFSSLQSVCKDFFSVDVRASWAGSSFTSSGKRCDATHLAFGKSDIRFKDIFQLSRLLADTTIFNTPASSDPSFPCSIQQSVTNTKLVNDNARIYFKGFAHEKLCFNGKVTSQSVSFNYSHRFNCPSITVGVQIPVVCKEHRLHYSFVTPPEVTSSIATELEQTSTEVLRQAAINEFQSRYGGFEGLFNELLSKKDLYLEKRTSSCDVGDVTFFANTDISSCFSDRTVVSLTLLVPSARKKDPFKVWHPDLGNGGFLQMGVGFSSEWQSSFLFNPHLFISAHASCSSTVLRRIPRYRTYTQGVTPDITVVPTPQGAAARAQTLNGTCFMLYGENISLKNKPSEALSFCEADTTIREWADEIHRIRIRRGAEVTFRLGNMFDLCCSHKFSADVFYNLYLKGKDYLGCDTTACELDRGLITRNSWSVKHTLAGYLSYQPTSCHRFNLGLEYDVAGRNSFQEFTVAGTFFYEF